jgi:hypothetical protein
MKEEKNSIGKTVWMEKEVIEMVKKYRKAQEEIPTFSHAVNTLLKKVLNDIAGKNRKT